MLIPHLQSTNIVEADEVDFVYVSYDDIEAGKQDCKKSCFAKLLCHREANPVGLQNSLCRARR